eukprot:547339-Pelagomonas_calceolata.AAC.1
MSGKDRGQKSLSKSTIGKTAAHQGSALARQLRTCPLQASPAGVHTHTHTHAANRAGFREPRRR